MRGPLAAHPPGRAWLVKICAAAAFFSSKEATAEPLASASSRARTRLLSVVSHFLRATWISTVCAASAGPSMPVAMS